MDEVRKAIEVLRQGGIVIFPTDTAIGIGCRIDNEDAVRKIFEIKKRDYNNPLMVLVDSIEMLKQYVFVSGKIKEKLIDKYWPGGLTIFFKCKLEKVPNIVRSGTDSLAIRLPAHEEIRNIIKKVGVPIIATSANLSGGKTPYSISEVDKDFASKVDLVFDGECTFKKESTIIDCTVEPWKIIRRGAVDI